VPRRRAVVLLTLVAGAAVLGWSLRTTPGSAWFYAASLIMALVWTVGGLASGPLRLGRLREERPLLPPLLLGLSLAGVFVVGGLLFRHVGFVDRQVGDVLAYADRGAPLVVLLVTVVNGIAEEIFFRGAAYAALPRPALTSTLLYAAVTAAAGNLMLTVAAALLGVVVARQREVTGGLLAPTITHVTWSVAMLYALPLVFA